MAEIKDFDPLTYFTLERLKLLDRVSQLAVVDGAIFDVRGFVPRMPPSPILRGEAIELRLAVRK